MSAIAGIVNFDGRPADSGVVEKMTDALAHLGPDGINHQIDGPVGFGHCLLRTTPESRSEVQPLSATEAPILFVMDGRLDNRDDLIAKLNLSGRALTEMPDPDLVIKAYEKWGTDLAVHIDGDYAIVIYDRQKRCCTFIMDRTGLRGLVYHFDGNCLIFASDICAISNSGVVPFEMNTRLVGEFLSYEWSSPTSTFNEHVRRAHRAHILEAKAGALRETRYWMPWNAAPIRYRDTEQYAEHYREILFRSVKQKSRSITGISCDVSGGLDSSAVFAVAHRLQQNGQLLAPEVAAYSLRFPDTSTANEIDYARAVTSFLGVPLNEVPAVFHPLRHFIERTERYGDFAGFPNAEASSQEYSEIAGRGFRVHLNGTGGDEWLDGSRAYYADMLKGLEIVGALRQGCIDSKALGAGRSLREFIRHGVLELFPETVTSAILKLRRRSRGKGFVSDQWLSEELRALLKDRPGPEDPSPGHQGVSKSKTIKLALLNDAYIGQMWAFGGRVYAENNIEVRTPLNCRKLIEFSFATPDSIFLRGNTYKYIHRVAMRDLLPEKVRHRSSKVDFMDVYKRLLDEMIAYLEHNDALIRPLNWIGPAGWRGHAVTDEESPGFGVRLQTLWYLVACIALRNHVNDSKSSESG